jgi:hypothetical protein
MAQRLMTAQLIPTLGKCCANTPERALVSNAEMSKTTCPEKSEAIRCKQKVKIKEGKDS